MNNFLDRISSDIPVSEIIQRTSEKFGLGTVRSSTPILTGYQEYNIDLSTSLGRFVIKIFSQEKTKQRIDDVIWGYIHLKKQGVPLPALKTTTDGNHILEFSGTHQPLYLCVFPFFAGKPLTHTPVMDTDLQTIARALAMIHNATQHIDRYYDTIGITELPKEFENKSAALFAEERALIAPIIASLQRIPISSFRQSIIHGSIEKENILKNADGVLCVLDLGCMDYNASVLDIATCIANMTLYGSEEKRIHVSKLILETYQQTHPLDKKELAALPTLIRAQYAAYALEMTYHMRINHDMTKQTQTLLDRGWDGLRLYAKVTRIT